MPKRVCLVCDSEDNLEEAIDLCVKCFYPGRILFFCEVCRQPEFTVRDALRVVMERAEELGQKVTIPERESVIFKANFCNTCRASQGRQFHLRVIAYGKALN